MSAGASREWLITAVVSAAALVLSAPFIGQLRTALRDALGDRFPTLMAVVVIGTAAGGLALALGSIRRHRGLRYGALTLALLIAVAYAAASQTGNAEVDAVERFHFIEYGVITLLFYKAWRPTGDGSALVMPVLAAFIGGVLDEWLQWFIPARIGEVRDVLLNLIAIGCGLLFALGLDPPPRVSLALAPASRRPVAWLAATAIVAFGLFFHAVHLGYEIADREAGVFRSRYTAAQLAALAERRADQWRRNPPLTWSRLSREDQYFSEGVAHIQQRNRLWAEGNVLAARHENLILEKYYAPVLDTPSYLSVSGHRWPAEQREQAESQPGPGFMIYDSDALPYPILTWPPWLFWLGLASLVVVVIRLLRPAARRGPPGEHRERGAPVARRDD
ncbi:MAG TPA: VanZ family protein [Vicinamibacterales bacterium]|nr:VanZ family protein [Vicinamibacterales bacterium]